MKKRVFTSVLLISFVSLSCAPSPAQRDWVLKRHLKDLASYAGSYPFTQDEVMADSMAKAAKEAGVPELTKNYFLRNIQRREGVITVKVHYQRAYYLRGSDTPISRRVVDYEITEKSKGR